MRDIKILLLTLFILIIGLNACTQKNPDSVKSNVNLTNVTSTTGWATIAPGEDLTLTHNLDRNDLTFVGAYSENGNIYQYGQYETRILNKSPSVITPYSASTNTIASLQNGGFVVAFKDDYSGYGKFVIYNSQGEALFSPRVFAAAVIGEDTYYSMPKISVLSNGNFVILYKEKNTEKGYFVIYDPSGNNILAGANVDPGGNGIKRVLIKDTTDNNNNTYTSKIDFPVITSLKNGNFVIAFRDKDYLFYGKFLIYTSEGIPAPMPPAHTYFASTHINYLSIATLNNDHFVITYGDVTNSNFGSFQIFDNQGYETMPRKVFEESATSYSSVSVLKNGYFAISYNSGGGGKVVVYKESGYLENSALSFIGSQVAFIDSAPLKDGNLVVTYQNAGYVEYVVYDYETIKFLTPVRKNIEMAIGTGEATQSNFPGICTLNNGNFVITYRDNGNLSSPSFVIKNANIKKPAINLQIINNNQAKLVNNTYETLSLYLGVNAQ